jgi:serralysin
MAAPVVTLKQQNVLLNSLISATDLFDATTDVEPITSYLFLDSNSDADTGFFRLDGLALANGSSFVVAAEDLSKVEYVGGSRPRFEQFRVVARNRIGEFSDSSLLASIYTVRPNTTAPLVARPSFEILANESVAASTFTRGFDPDGFPIEKYEFSDLTSTNYLQAISGRIFVGSYQHNFNTGEQVTLQGVSEAQFNVSGDITVVNENAFWIEDQAGVADGLGTTAGAGLFSVDGGYFNLGGANIAQGSTFEVTAEQLADLTYRATGPDNQENIFVRAHDGVSYGNQTRGVATTVLNANAPAVQFSRSTTPALAAHSFSDFLDISDADGSSIKVYGFYNTSPHANMGDLVLDGAPLARQEWVYVNASDLSNLTFEATQGGKNQLIRVQVYDGKLWSSIGTHEISSTVPAIRPEIEPLVDTHIAEQLEAVPLSGLFGISDSGLAHERVQIFEASTNPESGHLRSEGVPLPGGQVHEFSLAEYADVDFYTGEFLQRQNELIYQRNSNGTEWSKWNKVEIKTEPEIRTVLNTAANWGGILPVTARGKLLISYSFFQAFPSHNTGEAINGNPMMDEQFEPFDDEQRRNARLGFRAIEEIINVQFVEVADTSVNSLGQTGGIIRMGEYGLTMSNAQAFAFFPGGGPSGGDIWINRLIASDPQLAFDGPGFNTFLHEMGHVLGLPHVFQPADGGVAGLPPALASDDFSIMSGPTGDSQTGLSPATFQSYDTFQLQRDYGANMDFNSGDNVYTASSFGRSTFLETLWDAGGIDTFSGVDNTINSRIDLRQGEQSTFGDVERNLTLAFGADIENAIGSDFDDVIVGNQLDNVLVGGLGNDELAGNAGVDLLTGGAGNDTFVWGVGDGDDVINEQALAGRDTIRLSEFPGVDSVAQDLDFRLSGRDLLIDLTIDGGGVEGTLTVTNQLWGGYRVESLEIGSERIDLVNLVSQLAPGVEEFSVDSGTSGFGNLVVPVV